jgi:hypothetical protein
LLPKVSNILQQDILKVNENSWIGFGKISGRLNLNQEGQRIVHGVIGIIEPLWFSIIVDIE